MCGTYTLFVLPVCEFSVSFQLIIFHLISGDRMPHGMWKASAIQFTGNTWMVEYGRGFIPSTLNLPISSILFGTQDFITLYKMFKVYFNCMVMDWGNYIATLS